MHKVSLSGCMSGVPMCRCSAISTSIAVRRARPTDLVAPAWSIAGVAAASVSSIYSRHLLEHLDPEDARKTLRHWLELLRPGGTLNVIVPDVEFHARQLLGLAHSSLSDQAQHAWAGFWGWRDCARGGNREDAHRWGYTQATLTAELAQAGFTGIHRRTQGQDSAPWHLNLYAEKPSAE